MAELFVGVEQLVNVRKHPNADALDLANVGNEDGFQVVLGRDRYRDGDLVVYIPEGCIVPDNILEELDLVGKLGGRTKNVVKAIKLRGEISQGLVWVPASRGEGANVQAWLHARHMNPRNLAPEYGIVKFVPEVAIAMSGVIEPAPDIRPMFEVESIKKHHKVFEPGESVEITEKIHGTCFVATYHVVEDFLQVSSKGLSKDYQALKEDEKNLYWRAAHEYLLKDALHDLSLSYPTVQAISLFGEVFGEGVQDLHYGFNSRKGRVGFAAYALLLKYHATEKWVSPHSVLPYRVPCVPVLYIGHYDREIVKKLTDGREHVSGNKLHIREGVVVQANPPRFSKELGGLALVKSVSDVYLTRKATNGVQPTEYQ